MLGDDGTTSPKALGDNGTNPGTRLGTAPAQWGSMSPLRFR